MLSSCCIQDRITGSIWSGQSLPVSGRATAGWVRREGAEGLVSYRKGTPGMLNEMGMIQLSTNVTTTRKEEVDLTAFTLKSVSY